MTGFQLFYQASPGFPGWAVITIIGVFILGWIIGGSKLEDATMGMIIGMLCAIVTGTLLYIPQLLKQKELNEESNEVNIATFEDFYGVKVENSMFQDNNKTPHFSYSRNGALTKPFKVKSASGETFEVVVKIVKGEGFAYLYDGKLTPLEPAAENVTLK